MSGGYGSRAVEETASAMTDTAEFAADPAAVLHRVVGWAADHSAAGRHEQARHWTAVACVIAGDDDRGAVLGGLAARYLA